MTDLNNKKHLESKTFIHPSFNTWLKQMIDCCLVFCLLLLCSPVILIIWPLLNYLIGSPIIFKQKRLGKNGKVFTIYKLRTMVKNAESLRGRYKKQYAKLNYAPQPMFKIGNDPRFIKLGHFLSHSGLDELPQLINVLRGEMSLVGPRPLPVAEALSLKKIESDWFNWRHQVKPGIFSFWTLDDQRHQNLKIWKKLEKATLQLNLWQQYYLVIKVTIAQLKKINKF